MIIPTCRNCFFNCPQSVRVEHDFLCDLWEYFLDNRSDM